MSSDNNVTECVIRICGFEKLVCLCVLVCSVRAPILYDFRLHESVSSVFKRITLTQTVRQKDDIEKCQEV